MVRHIDAIFSQGAFRPLEPLTLPEGTRVQLRVEEKTTSSLTSPPAQIRTPKLANSRDIADFQMDVQEIRNAGI